MIWESLHGTEHNNACATVVRSEGEKYTLGDIIYNDGEMALGRITDHDDDGLYRIRCYVCTTLCIICGLRPVAGRRFSVRYNRRREVNFGSIFSLEIFEISSSIYIS